MKWQQFVMDEFLRIEDELGQVLKGMTVEDLNTSARARLQQHRLAGLAPHPFARPQHVRSDGRRTALDCRKMARQI
jgi:hypothetical protein